MDCESAVAIRNITQKIRHAYIQASKCDISVNIARLVNKGRRREIIRGQNKAKKPDCPMSKMYTANK